METPLCGRSGGHTRNRPYHSNTHRHSAKVEIKILMLAITLQALKRKNMVVSKKVCKVNIILIFALSNKQQQEYGTYTRTNFGNYFELHK